MVYYSWAFSKSPVHGHGCFQIVNHEKGDKLQVHLTQFFCYKSKPELKVSLGEKKWFWSSFRVGEIGTSVSNIWSFPPISLWFLKVFHLHLGVGDPKKAIILWRMGMSENWVSLEFSKIAIRLNVHVFSSGGGIQHV